MSHRHPNGKTSSSETTFWYVAQSTGRAHSQRLNHRNWVECWTTHLRSTWFGPVASNLGSGSSRVRSRQRLSSQLHELRYSTRPQLPRQRTAGDRVARGAQQFGTGNELLSLAFKAEDCMASAFAAEVATDVLILSRLRTHPHPQPLALGPSRSQLNGLGQIQMACLAGSSLAEHPSIRVRCP